MISNMELICLYDAMARLCKLYIALENNSETEKTIPEIKAEIVNLYSEILQIKTGRAGRA